MGRIGRRGFGLLLALGMILGSISPAWGDAHESTSPDTLDVANDGPAEPAGETGAMATDAATPQPSGATPEQMQAMQAMPGNDPDNPGAAADAGAADWAAPDPDRYPRLDVPTKPWAYDSGYFFALTRGLDDEGLSTWGRRASMVGTVPMDVVGLPTAALAGLFGS